MVQTLDNAWWNLDQTLIWIATSDLEQAQRPPEPWLYRRIVKFPSDIAFRRLKVPEGSKTGLHKPYIRMTVTELLPIPVSEEIEAERDAQKDLLAKLSAGLLKIETEDGEVKKAWFAGAEICFDDSGSAYLSRWKANLGRGQRHYPDRHDPVFLAADVVALFPAQFSVRSHSPPEVVELTAEPADAADFKAPDYKPDRSAAAARREWARLLLARESGTEPTLGFDDTVKHFTENFSIDRDTARDMIKGHRARGRPRAKG